MFVLPLAPRPGPAGAPRVPLRRRSPAPSTACSTTPSTASSAAALPAASRTPAMDVTETDTAYTVVFDVPGATREQLKVSVEGQRVVLSTAAAEREAAPARHRSARRDAQPADRALYRERQPPRYARTVVLPAEVDQAQSQAKFENGVLTLTLAKKVPARRDAAEHRLIDARAAAVSRSARAGSTDGQRPARQHVERVVARGAAMPRCSRIAAASAIIAPLSVHSASSG